MSSSKKVLFICLGNVCRSPIAEAVLKKELNDRNINGWQVHSAGTVAWSKGTHPDKRACQVMKKKNVAMDHTARQLADHDFEYYDIIFGMDHENMADLKRLSPKGAKASLQLFGSYDPEKELIIEDPYYDSGDEGFYTCYEQCLRCTKGFLDSLN